LLKRGGRCRQMAKTHAASMPDHRQPRKEEVAKTSYKNTFSHQFRPTLTQKEVPNVLPQTTMTTIGCSREPKAPKRCHVTTGTQKSRKIRPGQPVVAMLPEGFSASAARQSSPGWCSRHRMNSLIRSPQRPREHLV